MPFIAIEGIDGAGKATQASLLAISLEARGHRCTIVEAPNYKITMFGKLLGELLAGKHGDFANMSPKVASLPYMLDRFEMAQTIRQMLAEGQTVIADRYSGSNQIHQAGKCRRIEDRVALLDWLHAAEHGLLGNPEPDMVIYLKAPVDAALERLAEKRSAKNNELIDGETDQVERDRNYLENSVRMANWLADRAPTWRIVDCVNPHGEWRSRQEIHADVLRHIEPLFV